MSFALTDLIALVVHPHIPLTVAVCLYLWPETRTMRWLITQRFRRRH